MRDLTGQRFGRLVVISAAPKSMGRNARWNCLCDCGNRSTPREYNLVAGLTQSCGCTWATRRLTADTTKHGHARGHGTREYRSWCSMMTRCFNKADASYAKYGAAGITVCERWRDFTNFLADMGPRPPGKTLDRINNLGHYEPDNCRWATFAEQQRNRRNIRKVIRSDGQSFECIADAAKASTLHRSTVALLIRNGRAAKGLRFHFADEAVSR